MFASLLCLLALQTPPDTALPFAPYPVLDTLCSRDFFGRGYVKAGIAVAADYLVRHFNRLNLEPNHGAVYTQTFSIRVSAVHREPRLAAAGHTLRLGTDWLPDAACPSANGRYTALTYDSATWPSLLDGQQEKTALLFKKPRQLEALVAAGGPLPGLAIVCQKALPPHTIAGDHLPYPKVFCTDSAAPRPGQRVSFKLRSRLQEVVARNVVAEVAGTARPDSFIIVGAHYDHLGGIGPHIYFPGANDNASGTAMLMELASYVARHPLRYTVVFAAFAGEEAGLLGSKAFVNAPPMELGRVRFMLNLDLIGSGEDGATLVNAPAVQPDFDLLQAENARIGNALPTLRPRRNAPNSDHYPFAEAKVPAMFLYLQGPYAYYHSVEDKPRPELTLAGFAGTFRLCRAFLAKLAGG